MIYYIVKTNIARTHIISVNTCQYGLTHQIRQLIVMDCSGNLPRTNRKLQL